MTGVQVSPSDLVQAIPVVMALVIAVPFSLLPAAGKRSAFNLGWFLLTLATFVAAFALAPFHAAASFWVTVAGMVSSLALLGLLLVVGRREGSTRGAGRKPRKAA